MQSAPATLQHLEMVFSNVTNVLLSFGAFGFFVMLLIGGFKYLSSGGEPKSVEQAQKTLTYAFTGLVVLFGSFMILNIVAKFLGADATGGSANILDFRIKR